jgi:hypothetical protein
MNILALDTETTTFNKGNPYDQRNRLVCISFASDNRSNAVCVDALRAVIRDVESVDMVVGFNFKFDLAWLLKVGVYQLSNKQIWDVQIAEFILSNQTNRFPSLNETCERTGWKQSLMWLRQNIGTKE